MTRLTPPSPKALVGVVAGALLLTLVACGGHSDDHPAPYDLAYTVALADLDGDGRLDPVSTLATYGNGAPHPGMISVRLETAPATYAAPLRADAGADPVSMAVADLNGDGHPDLVVANRQLVGTLGSNTVVVFYQDPAHLGHFLAPVTLNVGTRNPNSVAVADLNGDGMPDIAVAGDGGDNNVVVFFQTAGGATPTWSAATPVDAGGQPLSLAAADLDGDGRLDLAVTRTDGQVAVLLQAHSPAAAGTFSAPVAYAAGTTPWQVRVGDLNGDGHPDLAVVCRDEYDGLRLLFQDPANAGQFLAATAYDTQDDDARGLALADLDGDGRLDIVVTNAGAPGWPGSMAVFRQSAAVAGSFGAPDLYRGYGWPRNVAVGDLNGDGRPDLLVADGDPLVRYQDAANPGHFMAPVALYH